MADGIIDTLLGGAETVAADIIDFAAGVAKETIHFVAAETSKQFLGVVGLILLVYICKEIRKRFFKK